MSRSTKKPYAHMVGFKHKNQRRIRDLSRKLIRIKSKRNVRALIDNPDLPYVGTSFKDGIDEWCFASDGHQSYIPEDWGKELRDKLMRK